MPSFYLIGINDRLYRSDDLTAMADAAVPGLREKVHMAGQHTSEPAFWLAWLKQAGPDGAAELAARCPTAESTLDRGAPWQLAGPGYQTRLLQGTQRWSGSDLQGKAKKYSGTYLRSRKQLLASLARAGYVAELLATGERRGLELWLNGERW